MNNNSNKRIDVFPAEVRPCIACRHQKAHAQELPDESGEDAAVSQNFRVLARHGCWIPSAFNHITCKTFQDLLSTTCVLDLS